MTDPLLQKYQLQGFWIKVFSTVAFTIFSYYISPGDSAGIYFGEGSNIFHLILKDPANIKLIFQAGKDFDDNLLADTFNSGYFKLESNYFVVRLVAIMCFFSFGKYLIMNLFFSMISFSGVWRLFKFFYEMYPHLHRKLAIAIIYLPTFVFWSSGILKDPICTGMLGWFTYAGYSVFYKRHNIVRNSIILVLSAYILAIVKVYILISYLPFFGLFLILKNVHHIKNRFGKMLLGAGLVVAGVVGFLYVAEKLKEELGFFAVDKLAQSVKTQQSAFANVSDLAESSFSLGVEFDGSLGSLAQLAPAAVTATLYRPYLWESKKVSTLLSSLESLAMMLFTLYVLYQAGIPLFFKLLFTDATIFYCLFFAILFALFIGATTLNFGTLVRYKIPCMPFYLIGLFLIQDEALKRKRLALLTASTVST